MRTNYLSFYRLKQYGARAALCLSLLLLNFSVATAQPPKQVLFIGNSFIGANNLPEIVKQLADRAGLGLEVFAHTPGGATVKFLPHAERSHAVNPFVYDLIRSRMWDFIVIQDNQGFFCLPADGDFGRYNETELGHKMIRDSLLKVNPCAKMILFSGWLDKDPYAWEPSLGLHTAAEGNQRVYEQYKILNDRHVKQIVSPIGIVWNRVMAARPGLELFAGDNYHPTYEGSYVTAAALFSTIFQQSAEEVYFDGPLHPDMARFIRKTAYDVIIDSVQTTGLNSIAPSLTLTGSTLSLSGIFSAYEWYRENIPVSGAFAATYSASAAGCYRAKVTDSKGCTFWSLPLCKAVTTGMPVHQQAGSIQVYPNPVRGKLFFRHSNLVQIRITDLSGKTILDLDGQSSYADMSNVGPGFYFLQGTDPSGHTITRKIIKE